MIFGYIVRDSLRLLKNSLLWIRSILNRNKHCCGRQSTHGNWCEWSTMEDVNT